MNLGLIGLALLMGAVTYPSRALPLLIPGIDRLPPAVREYLRLIGPATLAALAAVNALVVVGSDGRATIHAGIEALAVCLCMGVVAWRRSLLPGLAAAVLLVAGARWLGVG
jgi:branched-subunit amino acid transport protein